MVPPATFMLTPSFQSDPADSYYVHTCASVVENLELNVSEIQISLQAAVTKFSSYI